MTELDDELLPDVATIVTDLGRSATLTEARVPGDYNPLTGAVSGTPDSHTVLITPPAPYESRFVGGDLVQAGDSVVLLSARLLANTVPAVPDPDVGWTVLIDTKTWRVVASNPIWSGAQICAFELQLRGT